MSLVTEGRPEPSGPPPFAVDAQGITKVYGSGALTYPALRGVDFQAALDRLIVRAPIAGEVLQVLVRAGEYYQPGAGPLVVLGDTRELRVRMDVDERDVGKVAIGNAVTVRANAFAGVDFTGKVVEIGRRMGRKNVRTDDPTERADTKILEVLVALESPKGLVIGQRVTCYVQGAEARP
jgi:HlyD family secretion protein